MRWLFPRQLNDVLAQVSFNGTHVCSFKRMVEFDLFGRHRFALDGRLHATRTSQVDDVIVDVDAGFGPVNFPAVSFDLLHQLFEVVIEMINGVFLDQPGTLAQRFPVERALVWNTGDVVHCQVNTRARARDAVDWLARWERGQ